MSGGAFLHSGVLVALTNITFVANRAGEDGLAVMSLGLAESITNVIFSNNSFYCSAGTFGYERQNDGNEVGYTCSLATCKAHLVFPFAPLGVDAACACFDVKPKMFERLSQRNVAESAEPIL